MNELEIPTMLGRVDPLVCSRSSRIAVTVLEDGSVEVADNGRGMPPAPMTPGSSPGQEWTQRLKRVAPDGDGYGFRGAKDVP